MGYKGCGCLGPERESGGGGGMGVVNCVLVYPDRLV